MQSFVPKEVFLTRGVGTHKHRLSSFEEALRKAGVANQNLVAVSSILPPGCKIVTKKEGIAKIAPGAIRFAVIS
ncbi:pyruvoyl-dependent arginine decarboxylase, partial [Candidatus Latescibacterota bacterium]